MLFGKRSCDPAVREPYRGVPRSLLRRCLVVALALAAGCGGRESRTAETRSAASRPHVLVVALDACRADKFSAYGFERPTTPAFDALAAEPDSALFDWQIVQAPHTKASTASLFTGVYPFQHGVVAKDDLTRRAEQGRLVRRAGRGRRLPDPGGELLRRRLPHLRPPAHRAPDGEGRLRAGVRRIPRPGAARQSGRGRGKDRPPAPLRRVGRAPDVRLRPSLRLPQPVPDGAARRGVLRALRRGLRRGGARRARRRGRRAADQVGGARWPDAARRRGGPIPPHRLRGGPPSRRPDDRGAARRRAARRRTVRPHAAGDHRRSRRGALRARRLRPRRDGLERGRARAAGGEVPARRSAPPCRVA